MADTNPNETIYDDPARGTIAYATSAKLAINIQGVELSEDVLRINFTDSVSGTFDSETGTATIPITAGLLQGQQNQVLGRLTVGTGPFEAFIITDLEDQVTPAGGDALMGQRASDGKLIQIDVGNLPTGGGGEVNLGNNVGSLGVDLFAGKVGVTLEYRRLDGADTLETRTTGVPAHAEVGFQDAAQLTFVGRAIPGTGKPTFVPANSDVFKEAFQSNFQAPPDILTPGRTLVNSDYRRVLDLLPVVGNVDLVLPDATTLAQPVAPIDRSAPWCWARVVSVANLASLTTAVPGQLRSFNGYSSHDDLADTVYFGLSQATQRSIILPIYLIGTQWSVQGSLRDDPTADLTIDALLPPTNTNGRILSDDDHNEQFRLTGGLPVDMPGSASVGLTVLLINRSGGDVSMIGSGGMTVTGDTTLGNNNFATFIKDTSSTALVKVTG